ncbi:hypothetical protein T07_12585 [Trichinella nelsoni]|uniref:Zonadhesin n=1 Tax=Trichinella nelsoni TaxID=6336 RepID=A0A0V0RZ49_9BILA|nr:hypothetical protein T07_12585 [Trichinella nelsoni]
MNRKFRILYVVLLFARHNCLVCLNDDQTVRFNFTNPLQMRRLTLNQEAFRRKLTGFAKNSTLHKFGLPFMLGPIYSVDQERPLILFIIYRYKMFQECLEETQDQRMTAIPEKKTPEEIIKESEEQQLKAEKKQVGKTKKKTTSKKSKKAIKSTPKGTDISKEKTETDKKIEMAECSPETISAVAAKRNLIPQIVPKQITDWKETQDQRMTAIPEKKTPEEIIKESEEQQLKAEKKQVGKTKKKTTSKKSKKAIKSTPKGTDISKEKTETDKKIEMAESSPETISAVAAKRNLIPQIVPKVATEKKAAERIEEEESRKEKKKSKKKSKSHKSKKGETEVTVKQHMNKQTHQTEKAVMEAKTTTEITAAVSDETVIVQPITVEKKPDEFIKEVQKIEKKDSKKMKKKSKKRSKTKKSKKTVEDTVSNEAASTQMPETDITSPKVTLASEATAMEVDQPNIVPPIAEEAVEKPVVKDEPKGVKKDSKKMKKKSKKRSKTKKSNKHVEDKVAK